MVLTILLILINGIFYERKQYAAAENEKYLGEDFDYAKIKKDMITEYKTLLRTCIDMKTELREEYLLEYQQKLPQEPQSMGIYQASALLFNQLQYCEAYKDKYLTVKESSEKMLESQLFSEKDIYA